MEATVWVGPAEDGAGDGPAGDDVAACEPQAVTESATRQTNSGARFTDSLQIPCFTDYRVRMARGKPDDGLDSRLVEFIGTMTPATPGDLDALGTAGRALGVVWPADYEAIMTVRDGGTGEIDGWPVQLYPAGKLVEVNAGPRGGTGTGVVWFGWDGFGESYGFDRASGKVVLRTNGDDVEVKRDSILDWIRHPPDFSDSRYEAVRSLALAEARRNRRG